MPVASRSLLPCFLLSALCTYQPCTYACFSLTTLFLGRFPLHPCGHTPPACAQPRAATRRTRAPCVERVLLLSTRNLVLSLLQPAGSARGRGDAFGRGRLEKRPTFIRSVPSLADGTRAVLLLIRVSSRGPSPYQAAQKQHRHISTPARKSPVRNECCRTHTCVGFHPA